MSSIGRYTTSYDNIMRLTSVGEWVKYDEYKKLVEQVELLTAQKVALIEYIKNPPQPSEETKRINEYWRGYNER